MLQEFSLTTPSTAALRDALRWLRARYDDGKVAPAVFAVIRNLEVDIAWREHAELLRTEGSA